MTTKTITLIIGDDGKVGVIIGGEMSALDGMRYCGQAMQGFQQRALKEMDLQLAEKQAAATEERPPDPEE